MTVTNYPFKVENKSRHKPTFSQKKNTPNENKNLQKQIK